MAYLTFSWWDYLLVFIIVGSSISIGIYYGFFKRNNASSTDDIYLAKDMKPLPIAISLIASTISVPDILSTPTEIYMYGTQFWMEILSLPIMALIIIFIYLPLMYNLKLSSTYQYLEKRFNAFVSRLCLVSSLLSLVSLIPLFIYASSLVLNQVSGYGVHTIAIVVSSICIFYTAFGGLKAVIWADTLQFTVTLLSLTIAMFMGVISAGGFEKVWQQARAGDRLHFFILNPDPTIRTTFWNVLIGHICRWTVTTIGHPAVTQRLLSASNIVDSKRLLLFYVIGMMFIKSIICFSGLIVYSKYSDCDPLSTGDIKAIDQIVPYYVLDVASTIPGLGTMFIAGLIAVSLSVLSTMLNTSTCILYFEFLSHFLSPSVKKKWAKSITRIIPVLTGIIGIGLVFVAEKITSLFEMTYIAMGSYVGVTLGVFIMGAMFPFANVKGALFGGIVSITFMLFLVIKTQIYAWNGVIWYESKPLSVDGCNKTDLNITSTILQSADSQEPLWLFRISFHYYICIGCLICMIIGLPVSWFTRKGENVDPDLLTPVIRKLIFKTAPTKHYESLTVLKEKPFEKQTIQDDSSTSML